MNGQKFVLKKAKGTRKQFMVVNNKVSLAFINKGKKFTACSTFLDITDKVKFRSTLQLKYNYAFCKITKECFNPSPQATASCKTISGLATVDLPTTQAPTTTMGPTTTVA